MTEHEKRHVNQVLFTMQNINNSTDDLYEAMMDVDSETVIKTCNSLISRLNIIKSNYKIDEPTVSQKNKG